MRELIKDILKERSSYLDTVLNECHGKDIVLFGASVAGKHAPSYLKKNNISVKYYCDNDPSKHGRIYNGIECVSPSKLLDIHPPPFVLITSSYVNDIRRQLHDLGLEHIYNLPLLGSPIETQQLFDGELYHRNDKAVMKLYDELEDDKSKMVLLKIIKLRKTGDFSQLDDIVEEDMYFPQDIISLDNNECFIDGGAYTGDTAEQFIINVNNEFEKIYVFEPDKINYNLLSKKYITDSRVEAINKGLDVKNRILNFNSGKMMESMVSDSGEDQIEVVSLDSLIHDKITFVKMDIEGAELEALHGMKNIINNQKPKMSICVYHKPEHLWEIPLFLKNSNPDYQLFLRHHSISVTDTVCYATNK